MNLANALDSQRLVSDSCGNRHYVLLFLRALYNAGTNLKFKIIIGKNNLN